MTTGVASCACTATHAPRLVVLTGGPGAGKTAVLEVFTRRNRCAHVTVLPEAASVIFSGGFPRRGTEPGRRAAQRAIFAVQRELERLDEGRAALTLCDRGSVDGAAYWPGSPEAFFAEVGTTREAELARYAAVIHLRAPTRTNGYNHQNPIRIETAEEAAEIDGRILELWSGHPHRTVIESTNDFLGKLEQALAAIERELPACCASRDANAAQPVILRT